MGTLAYCSKKYGLDPDTKQRLKKEAKVYQEQGFNKHESELQVADDAVEFIDKEFESIVSQTEALVRQAVKDFESAPGQWFKWPFVQKNKMILENKIREFHNALYDTQSFIDSGLYVYDQPIPKTGGIIAATGSKKYSTDKAYKKWVDGKIAQIRKNILEANRSRMILLGKPHTIGDFRVAREFADQMPEPYYKAGSEEASENVEATYGADMDRLWTLEAQSLYGENNLGDIGIREAVQNAMDAVMEAVDNKMIKAKDGRIEINTYHYDSDESSVGTQNVPHSHGFEVIDNGIGMNTDAIIRDKFLKIAGSGKAKAGRFGGFGVAKAVILKPKAGTAWYLETNNHYFNSQMAEQSRKVADMAEPRRGTKIWVRAPETITSPKARTYLETTEPPKGVKIIFNGNELGGDAWKKPFAGKKAKIFNYDIFTDKTYTDENGNEVDGSVHYTIRYYSKPPQEYDQKIIIRLDDDKTGAKLTQGIGWAGSKFPGAMIVDIKTKATPEQDWYPLEKSRQDIKWGDARAPLNELKDKFVVDKRSTSRDIESEMKDLVNRSEWKKVWQSISGVTTGKPNAGYKKFTEDMKKIFEDNKDLFDDDLSLLDPDWFYTPIDKLMLQVDKGHKGYKGGTLLHARLIAGYEATARLLAKRLNAKVGTFYPMLSKTDETGGHILAEYGPTTGSLGFNHAVVAKDALKSPLNLAFYMFSSANHELTHARYHEHDEDFSSGRESNERKSADIFPQVLRIAEAIVGKKDTELVRVETKEVPVEKIVTKTETIEKIVTHKVEVPVEKFIETEVKKYLAQRQKELVFNEERNTEDDEYLYIPDRPKEGKRQLRLFGRTMAGIDARRVSVVDPKRPWGSTELPVTPGDKAGGQRSVQPGPVSTGIKPLMPGYYRTKAGKILYIRRSDWKHKELTIYSVDPKALAEGKIGSSLRVKAPTRDKLWPGKEYVGFGNDKDAAARGLYDYAKYINATPVKIGFGGDWTEIDMPELPGANEFFFGIPVGSMAQKVFENTVEISQTTPDDFSIGELNGLARLTNTKTKRTKKDTHKAIVDSVGVFETLAEYDVENAIDALAVNQPAFTLNKMLKQLDIAPAKGRVDMATQLMKHYVKTMGRSFNDFKEFYEMTGRDVPADIEDAQSELKRAIENVFGKDLKSKVLDLVGSISPDFDTGELASVEDVLNKIPEQTGLRPTQVKSGLRQAMRDGLIYGGDSLSKDEADLLDDAQKDKMILFTGRYFKSVGRKSSVDHTELIKRLDSARMPEILSRRVSDIKSLRDTGEQLGLAAIESLKVRRSLRTASDKLDRLESDLSSDNKFDERLKLQDARMVLNTASAVLEADQGADNAHTALIQRYRKDPGGVRNFGLLKKAFISKPVVRESGPISQYMATRAVKEEYRKRYLRDQGITKGDVRRLFKTETVLQSSDGNMHITTKGGHKLIIKSMDSIDPDNASFFVAYGRKPIKGDEPVGRYKDGVISLHKDLSNNWVLDHETMHWMEDAGIITAAEVDTLRNHIQDLYERKKWRPANKRDVGGAEDRANYIALKLAVRRDKVDMVGFEGILNKILQKIQDLIDGFVGLFRLTPGSIVRDVATGAMLKRPAAATDLPAIVASGFSGYEGKIKIDGVERYYVESPQEKAFVAVHGNKKEAQRLGIELSTSQPEIFRKVGQWWKNRKEIGMGLFEDTTAADRLLFSPLHYFHKIPAMKAIAEDGMVRSDNYYKKLHDIERNRMGQSRIQLLDKFRKGNKKEYARLQKYLDYNDNNKFGFSVRAIQDDDARYDDARWEIFNPEGDSVGTSVDIDDAWRVATQLEMQALRDAGFSEAAVEALKHVRVMNHNGFNILIRAMRDLIRQHAKSKTEVPKVATWVDGEKVEVDLKVALKKMNDMRGYYMPRIRRPGRFTLRATKRGANPILEHFETKEFAAKRASDLEDQGYTSLVDPINKIPEDVFQLAGEVISFQTMMNEALDKVSKDMKKGESVETMRLLKKAQLAMGKAMAEGVANIFKGRGVRAHMIMRNDATGENVWKGYEEDIVQRMAKYARGLAAGEAKKQMAFDMLQHFTGTDVSWQDYKGQMENVGLDPVYTDYLMMVKGRRVDPINQKNAYHDGLTYMSDMLRNDEFVDRFIGMVKGVAVLKYLAGRVSAPLVNLTALATSVPGTMSGYANIPLHKAPKYIAEGMKGWRRYRQALKGKGTIADWEMKLYNEIEDNGWHQAQYNKEALSVLKSKFGNKYDNMLELLMVGFGATEMLNRVATIAGAYKGVRDQNIDKWNSANASQRKAMHKKWLATAKEVSDKAHGIYSKANRPHYARGGNITARLAQTFYVFKTFSHNYLQTMYDLGFRTKDRKGLLYMALSPAIIGGVTASPLLKMMIEAFGLLPGAPDEPEEAIYEWMETNMGDRVESLARLGLFGGAGFGVSLKGSLEIGITDLPTSIRDLTGAPGSMLYDIWQGGRSIGRGDYLKGFEKLSPNFIGSAIKAVREATEGLTTNSNAPVFFGKEPVKLTFMEALIRGLSFNPARIARIREKHWKERKLEMDLSEARGDIYAQIKAFYLKPRHKRNKVDWMDIVEEIQIYNEHIQESGKPLPYITSKSIRNNLRRAFRPSKKERARGF